MACVFVWGMLGALKDRRFPIVIVSSTMLPVEFFLCLLPNASGDAFSNAFPILPWRAPFPKGSRITYTGSFFSTLSFFFCLVIGWH